MTEQDPTTLLKKEIRREEWTINSNPTMPLRDFEAHNRRLNQLRARLASSTRYTRTPPRHGYD